MKSENCQVDNIDRNEYFWFSQKYWLHIILLLGSIAIGTILRFANLAAKPPWNDEFATLVFSLGNSYRAVPIDQVITLDTLLKPLQPNPNAGINDLIQNLMRESTHPPVYFVLTHLWLKLFPQHNGLVSIWAARSLSAILGVASIPAIFCLGCLVRSRVVGQIAAAIMAVSPYAIYQAQEARHYTLAILVIIASLSCFVTATRNIQRHTPLPVWLVLTWIIINSLGIAVHYFFTLTLCAEALVLLKFWLPENIPLDFVRIRRKKLAESAVFARNYSAKNHAYNNYPYWSRLYAVAAGTLIGALVWFPAWQNVPDNQVTQWIFDSNHASNLLETITRALAWLITMVAMLPIEGTPLSITIISGGVLISFSLWILSIIFRGGIQSKQLETQVLKDYILAAIALVFIITYIFGADLTIAARYQFFYFPAVILFLASAFSNCWNPVTFTRNHAISTFRNSGIAVVLTLLMGFLGALTVISNYGYQKPDRPDLLVPIIQMSSVPTLIATTHFTHEQIGEMMGLALEFKRSKLTLTKPLFLLAHLKLNSQTSIDTLQKIINQQLKPLNVWVVNFLPTPEPVIKKCILDLQKRPKMNGYKHRLYYCK